MSSFAIVVLAISIAPLLLFVLVPVRIIERVAAWVIRACVIALCVWAAGSALYAEGYYVFWLFFGERQ